MTFRENARMFTEIRAQAVTDALTGLGNRRRLIADLGRALARGQESEPRVLVVFDLDGFKRYNDLFGHPAGDALLSRLAASLSQATEAHGSSYRLGGDEFCVLATPPADEVGRFLEVASEALTEDGEVFSVSSSFGAVFLPEEAAEISDALRIADQRLYAHKHSTYAGRGQPHEVLLQALYEREPAIRAHVQAVAELALAWAGGSGSSARASRS